MKSLLGVVGEFIGFAICMGFIGFILTVIAFSA
jgi:hypothetical protein